MFNCEKVDTGKFVPFRPPMKEKFDWLELQFYTPNLETGEICRLLDDGWFQCLVCEHKSTQKSGILCHVQRSHVGNIGKLA